jgi:hypothetical protein
MQKGANADRFAPEKRQRDGFIANGFTWNEVTEPDTRPGETPGGISNKPR